MDNRTAFWIAVVLVALFAADFFYFSWGLPQFVGIQITRIIEWLAFWR